MNEEHYLEKKIYSKKQIEEYAKRIKLLGTTNNLGVYQYLNIRYIGTLIVFIITIFISKIGYIMAPILAFLYYKSINYFLIDYKIKQRTRNLEREALSFFEILTLSLETGRNLTEALNVTTESCSGELVSEFKEVTREVKYGKSLTEALDSMQERIPSDIINNILLSLTQANLYGSSIIKSLYNQIDYLREKRKLEVKAEISKVPIKISVISVFFFIPLILFITLAPVVLNYIAG